MSNTILSITHSCNTKKWSLKKAVAETSHTNILVVNRLSSIYHSLFNICVYICLYLSLSRYMYIETDSTEDLRKRESFWEHELDTFQPNGLNEHEVALF